MWGGFPQPGGTVASAMKRAPPDDALAKKDGRKPQHPLMSRPPCLPQSLLTNPGQSQRGFIFRSFWRQEWPEHTGTFGSRRETWASRRILSRHAGGLLMRNRIITVRFVALLLIVNAF